MLTHWDSAWAAAMHQNILSTQQTPCFAPLQSLQYLSGKSALAHQKNCIIPLDLGNKSPKLPSYHTFELWVRVKGQGGCFFAIPAIAVWREAERQKEWQMVCVLMSEGDWTQYWSKILNQTQPINQPTKHNQTKFKNICNSFFLFICPTPSPSIRLEKGKYVTNGVCLNMNEGELGSGRSIGRTYSESYPE